MFIVLLWATGNEEPFVAHETVLLSDCTRYLESMKGCTSVLSAVGSALSMESRQYLCSQPLGLKHSLIKYPKRFLITGSRGKETVTLVQPRVNDLDAVLCHTSATHSEQTPVQSKCPAVNLQAAQVSHEFYSPSILASQSRLFYATCLTMCIPCSSLQILIGSASGMSRSQCLYHGLCSATMAACIKVRPAC